MRTAPARPGPFLASLLLVIALAGCSALTNTPSSPTAPAPASTAPTAAPRTVVVTGEVSDQDGAAVGGAIVSFIATGATEITKPTRTDTDGLYLVQLPPGTYTAGCSSSRGACSPDLPGKNRTIQAKGYSVSLGFVVKR